MENCAGKCFFVTSAGHAMPHPAEPDPGLNDVWLTSRTFGMFSDESLPRQQAGEMGKSTLALVGWHPVDRNAMLRLR